ncbi:hypothetical protein RIF29_00624 [Crotalaria pallida]|uniref:non-specific serine/threonine protein kinase n=1 Tax=Crotalaria pallida TaxID=3830 RepID=A0AAN9IVS0_CROPI
MLVKESGGDGAGRRKPRDASGIVKIHEDGNLVVLNGKNNLVIWSSKVSSDSSTNSSAQLEDTGNLVLRDLNSGETMWDSFTHPADAAVPTMKIASNPYTGLGLEPMTWRWENPKCPCSHQLGYLTRTPLFDFEKLAAATNNFHFANMLGKGGFGPVYKGQLENGQEIAVKRFSKASTQGLEEFMNEVVVISKLQHRNLVRLLGCCVEGEEQMLIYEFMPNKSLDAFIFDPLQRKVLDWKKRFNIIEGIARGILYLHRDSRLRIIHRDLKASNILLDDEMNPKILDFGLARIFKGGEDFEVITRRVVGTYGYMPPEYAMEGLFSEKSDVYSFGVLLLEIVSGRRNTSFHNNEESLSLVGFAWKLWKEGNILSLIDPRDM